MDEDEILSKYRRVSKREEPTDYARLSADLALLYLLEGFNYAITKYSL